MDANDELPTNGTPFTRAEAPGLGYSPGQLNGKQIEHVSRSIYRPPDWQFNLREAARALSAASPGGWISHGTAARIHGLVLPPWLSDSNELHLSKPRELPQLRRKGITPHNVSTRPGEVEFIEEMWISTRARTWLDLARVLPLRDLICLGDQLIRIPRPEFEGRSDPFTTLKKLRGMVESHKNLQGIVRARQALELMRVGADSPPETLMRLAMADANLPEPALQLKLWDGRNSPSADAGYRPQRIALQYDGAHHLDEIQRRKDQHRDKAFRSAGWTVLTFTESDLNDGFRDAVRRIKTALRQSLVDPTVASGFASGN